MNQQLREIVVGGVPLRLNNRPIAEVLNKYIMQVAFSTFTNHQIVDHFVALLRLKALLVHASVVEDFDCIYRLRPTVSAFCQETLITTPLKRPAPY